MRAARRVFASRADVSSGVAVALPTAPLNRALRSQRDTGVQTASAGATGAATIASCMIGRLSEVSVRPGSVVPGGDQRLDLQCSINASVLVKK
jgi:hypothetical protein